MDQEIRRGAVMKGVGQRILQGFMPHFRATSSGRDILNWRFTKQTHGLSGLKACFASVLIQIVKRRSIRWQLIEDILNVMPWLSVAMRCFWMWWFIRKESHLWLWSPSTLRNWTELVDYRSSRGHWWLHHAWWSTLGTTTNHDPSSVLVALSLVKRWAGVTWDSGVWEKDMEFQWRKLLSRRKCAPVYSELW